MTDEEKRVMELSVELHNAYSSLPVQHQNEPPEWCVKIHDIQRMILSRPGVRQLKESES